MTARLFVAKELTSFPIEFCVEGSSPVDGSSKRSTYHNKFQICRQARFVACCSGCIGCHHGRWLHPGDGKRLDCQFLETPRGLLCFKRTIGHGCVAKEVRPDSSNVHVRKEEHELSTGFIVGIPKVAHVSSTKVAPDEPLIIWKVHLLFFSLVEFTLKFVTNGLLTFVVGRIAIISKVTSYLRDIEIEPKQSQWRAPGAGREGGQLRVVWKGSLYRLHNQGNPDSNDHTKNEPGSGAAPRGSTDGSDQQRGT
jgi:hypothetical protein